MDKCWLSVFTALVFQTLHSCTGQPDLICSHGPITVLAGDDVILPCHLEPSIRADSMTVVWTKPSLDPKYVHYHQDGRLISLNQDPSYYYRTRLFVDELKNGNVSMKIMKVVLSDGGEYKCIIPSIQKNTSIQLIVGSVSSPVVSITNSTSITGVVLQCESAGWYPEPEVLWLDAEGDLLSAGRPETVRGPDDLYTVSSRVTVDKRHNNSFTCRVQQNNINQTREAHIHVADEFFKTPSSNSSSTSNITGIVIGIVILILLIVASVVLRKQNQKKMRNQGSINNNQSNSTNHDVLPLNDRRRNSLDRIEIELESSS